MEHTSPERSNRNLKIVIWILIAILVIGVVAVISYVRNDAFVSDTADNTVLTPAANTVTETEPTPATPKPAEQAVSYSVVIKENPSDKSKSDVYLKDSQTGAETFYMTLADVYRSHYHNAEYHNGNVYIIQRTGGDEGYQTNPKWTNELWKYNKDKQGAKLFANRGLDFRVSDDEKFIAITSSGANGVTGEQLTFVQQDGTVLKKLMPNQMGLKSFAPLLWYGSDFWVSSNMGAGIEKIAKVSANNFQSATYDVSGLKLTVSEFAVNPVKARIAFSNYPAMFDVESAQEYERSQAKVDLKVYDLETKKEQLITTSTVKKFAPKWLDATTLEYNDPNGTGRITKRVE